MIEDCLAEMSSSERYRARARECATLAEHAPDLVGREFFAQLARVWNDLANRAEQAAPSQEIPLALRPDSERSDS
jgi:hypothetical protein